MNKKVLKKLFNDTAYVRTGGSAEELRCAEYIKDRCSDLGVSAAIEPFKVDMANIKRAELYIDGVSIPCKGYLCCGSGEVEAPLYYLRDQSLSSLRECRGKIVIFDGYLRYWLYHDMLDNGALGFITFDGNANYSDRDIDQRELRGYVSNGRKALCVNINVKSAIDFIKKGAKTAKIVIEQDEYEGESRNVTAFLPGEIDEEIVLTAHYDSTALSQGAYDNMSGSVGILAALEYFTKNPHRYSLRFVWCGSEERGLLGSKAYVEALGEEELKKIALNINLDMIGCIMGGFIACCTCEDKLVHYIEYMAAERGFGIKARQDVYSSDSTPFADKGVPSLSFARIAASNCATIHNSYDTQAVMSMEQMAADIEFINAFTERMANAKLCPVSKEIPDSVKKKLDYYMLREREKN